MLTFEFLYGGYIAIYLINSVEKAMFLLFTSLPAWYYICDAGYDQHSTAVSLATRAIHLMVFLNDPWF